MGLPVNRSMVPARLTSEPMIEMMRNYFFFEQTVAGAFVRPSFVVRFHANAATPTAVL